MDIVAKLIIGLTTASLVGAGGIFLVGKQFPHTGKDEKLKSLLNELLRMSKEESEDDEQKAEGTPNTVTQNK